MSTVSELSKILKIVKTGKIKFENVVYVNNVDQKIKMNSKKEVQEFINEIKAQNQENGSDYDLNYKKNAEEKGKGGNYRCEEVFKTCVCSKNEIEGSKCNNKEHLGKTCCCPERYSSNSENRKNVNDSSPKKYLLRNLTILPPKLPGSLPFNTALSLQQYSNLFYTILRNNFSFKKDQVLAFLNAVIYYYNENVYHNIFHAFDTFFTVFYLSKRLNLDYLLALILHDVGHLGFTSKFLSTHCHFLHDKFGPDSLNEKMHIYIGNIILKETLNLELDIETYIIGTDLKLHDKFLENFYFVDEYIILLKISDISNCLKDFIYCQKIGKKVFQELDYEFMIDKLINKSNERTDEGIKEIYIKEYPNATNYEKLIDTKEIYKDLNDDNQYLSEENDKNLASKEIQFFERFIIDFMILVRDKYRHLSFLFDACMNNYEQFKRIKEEK